LVQNTSTTSEVNKEGQLLDIVHVYQTFITEKFLQFVQSFTQEKENVHVEEAVVTSQHQLIVAHDALSQSEPEILCFI
jgi:hypothetical protein